MIVRNPGLQAESRDMEGCTGLADLIKRNKIGGNFEAKSFYLWRYPHNASQDVRWFYVVL